MMDLATVGSTHRGLLRYMTKPKASAPTPTATFASSPLVIPQILIFMPNDLGDPLPA